MRARDLFFVHFERHTNHQCPAVANPETGTFETGLGGLEIAETVCDGDAVEGREVDEGDDQAIGR